MKTATATKAPKQQQETNGIAKRDPVDHLQDIFRERLMDRKVAAAQAHNEMTLSQSWRYVASNGIEVLDQGESLDELVKLTAADLSEDDGDVLIWRLHSYAPPRCVALVRGMGNGTQVTFL